MLTNWWRGDIAGQTRTLVLVGAVVTGEINASIKLLPFVRLGSKYPYRMFCPPEGYSNQQAAELVMRYMDANLPTRHLDAVNLTRAALLAAWPCAENPTLETVQGVRSSLLKGADLPASLLVDE